MGKNLHAILSARESLIKSPEGWGSKISPSGVLEQINVDFPGLWAQIEKKQPSGAAWSFPIVKDSAHKSLPPGSHHPFAFPVNHLINSAAARGEDVFAIKSLGLPGDALFVAYSKEALQAVAAWRTTKLHYQVDPDFWDELASTPLKGTPPSIIFERLPARAFFISRKDGCFSESKNLSPVHNGHHGFFVHVLPGILSITPLSRTSLEGKLEIHLGKMTVEEALEMVCEEDFNSALLTIRAHPGRAEQEKANAEEEFLRSWPKVKKNILSMWYGVLSNILYLCVEEPDLEDKILPTPKISRLGSRIRFSSPVSETQIKVGVRLGAIFRKYALARNEEQLSSPSGRIVPPHVRRAHWHTYWTGKKGDQKPVVKWLSPIIVNAFSTESLAETVHPVLR